MAVTDNPCASFAKELVEIYPKAKIILTVRDSAEAWHASILKTVYQGWTILDPEAIRRPGTNPLGLLQKILAPTSDFLKFARKLFDVLDCENVPESGAQMYLEHNDNIRQLAAKREFLEFNERQGWGPLCEFLGKPVPEKPFPKVNDSANFQQNRLPPLRFIMRLMYLVNAGLYVSLPLLLTLGGYWYQTSLSSWVRGLTAGN